MLTCKDHKKGTNHFLVHCFRNNTNFPSPVSDQLYHDVVKTKTMKITIVRCNSTGYQMVEQTISWKGIDSINVTCVGRTNHNSVLLRELETLSYVNRSDMKKLM